MMGDPHINIKMEPGKKCNNIGLSKKIPEDLTYGNRKKYFNT